MEAVAGEAVTRLSDFNPQELSNLLVAYARTNYLKVPLLEVCNCSNTSDGGVHLLRHEDHTVQCL